MKKFNFVARKRARRLVLQALYQWHLTENPLLSIQEQFLISNEALDFDRDYFTNLFNSIPKSLNELNGLISPCLDRDIQTLDKIELVLLQMGCYELKECIDIPYRVVINEAVELAKQFGATDGHKYVNNILDQLAKRLREQEIDEN